MHSLVFGAADFYAYSTDTGGGPSTFVAINKQCPFPSLSYPLAQTVVTENGTQFPFPSLSYPTSHTTGGRTHSPSDLWINPSAQTVWIPSAIQFPFPSLLYPESH